VIWSRTLWKCNICSLSSIHEYAALKTIQILQADKASAYIHIQEVGQKSSHGGIMVLRAHATCAGAKDPSDSSFTFDASRPMLPRILEQLRDEAAENVARNNRRPPAPMPSGMPKMASAPCTLGPDGKLLPCDAFMRMRMTADV